jgi:hypothetical protein
MNFDCVYADQNNFIPISYHHCTISAPRDGGPVGEFPANIFEPAKKKSEKNLRANNNKKQADHGLTEGSTFDHDLFPPPLTPPLVKQYHSLDKGICIFSRRFGITHTLVDAVALVKLA